MLLGLGRCRTSGGRGCAVTGIIGVAVAAAGVTVVPLLRCGIIAASLLLTTEGIATIIIALLGSPTGVTV